MEQLQIRRAVITGPTGAVGIALIEELIQNEIEVYAICRPSSKRLGRIPANPLVQVIEADLTELDKVNIDKPCDAFYHFGWDGTYGASREDLYLQNRNIAATLDAVNLAHRTGCQVFIGAGSQAEYGAVEGKIGSDTPCFPVTGYGIAKLAACGMSRNLCGQLGIRHVWCRIISLFGPYDGEYTMVMSGIIQMLQKKRPKYTKGEQVWDYIYSKDAALAFRLAAERGKDGAIYCLGSGKSRLLRDYIYAIRDIAAPGMDVGIGELEYYPNQVMHLSADVSNLEEDTGFAPRYTFEQGIEETVRWAEKEGL